MQGLPQRSWTPFDYNASSLERCDFRIRTSFTSTYDGTLKKSVLVANKGE